MSKIIYFIFLNLSFIISCIHATIKPIINPIYMLFIFIYIRYMDEKYIEKKIKSIDYYAMKYHIDVDGLTHKEIVEKVYHYEMKHLLELINKGKDMKTKEIGYFIQS